MITFQGDALAQQPLPGLLLVAGRASAGNPLVIELQGAQPAAVAKVEEDGDGEGLVGRRFFVGLLVGAGAGWATGDGDTNADTMYHPAAFALAGLGQLAPESGYWVAPTLMISLQGRFEAVTGTTDVYADGRRGMPRRPYRNPCDAGGRRYCVMRQVPSDCRQAVPVTVLPS